MPKPFDAIFLVAPLTNATTLCAFIDTMRAANRMCGHETFRYRIASVDGAAVAMSNGLMLPADFDTQRATIEPHVFILASYEPSPEIGRRFMAYLRRAAVSSSHLYGIDQGGLILAAAGLLDGYSATTHWEVLPAAADRFVDVDFKEALFLTDRNRTTCAGHTAAIDLALQIVEQQGGRTLALQVMQEIIYTQRRSATEVQRLRGTGATGAVPRRLEQAINLMSSHLDTQLSIFEIARNCGVGKRQLENWFVADIAVSPANYYRRLRLGQARQLLLYSSSSILEIAETCGFSSSAVFSRAFRAEFQTTPRSYRRDFVNTLKRPISGEVNI